MKTLKKIKHCALSLMAMFALASSANAQKDTTLTFNQPYYHTAIGLRGGGTTGITVKRFITSKSALEGIFGVWSGGMSATVMYERHVTANLNGLQWYYGLGGHATFFDTRRFVSNLDQRYFREYNGVGVGIDGIVGLEYKIIPIPFAISLDVKPFIEVNNTGGVIAAFDPSLGIKFTF